MHRRLEGKLGGKREAGSGEKSLNSRMETAILSLSSQSTQLISSQGPFNNIKNAKAGQGKLQPNKEYCKEELDLPLRAVFDQIPPG